MTIEEAIERLEGRYMTYSMLASVQEARAENEAIDMALSALLAQQEAEKNEPPVRCKDCVCWEQIDAMGGDNPGKLEHLGKCVWIRGSTMASDFCSKGKRRPPEKEKSNGD